MLRLVSQDLTLDAAAGGRPRRTLAGVALPYNVDATISDGRKVRFMPGSLDANGKMPKMYMYHQPELAIGLVTAMVDTPEAMMYEAKISATPQGDIALTLAVDRVLDAVSVGVEPTAWTIEAGTGVMVITAGIWQELSLVPYGAFAGATVDQVAASIHVDTAVTDIGEKIAAALDKYHQKGIHQPAAKVDIIVTATPKQELTAMNETAVIEAPTVIEAAATAPLYAQPRRDFRMPSAAEWITAFHIGGDTWKNTQQAYVAASNVKASPLQAAAGDILTTDIPGIIPVPILGPVFEDINFMRPVINALGARPMPSTMSKTFIRPTITTHTSVGEQTEATTVSRTTMVVASNVVTKKTIAGGVTFTYQDVDFSDPAAVQIVLNDLAGVYMDSTDDIAADALLAAATTSGVWDLTLADLLKSVWDSATTITATTNFLPTHMFVDPATWALIGQLTDLDGRPVFHNLLGGGQSVNSYGEASPALSGGLVLGLKLVVDKNFAAKTMVICNSNAFEVYEERKGLVSVENAQLLERDVSLYGYLATFRANATMIRKITQA